LYGAAGPQFARADDLADFERIRPWSSSQRSGRQGVGSPSSSQSVSFISEQPEAIDRGLERITITPRDMQYRLVGDIGIAWGFQRHESKPKGGTLTVREERVLRVWSKTDGRWLLVTSHFSALPATKSR
jgi:hypothetical protein